jgi:SAM-dependent methyltransferase
MLILRKGLSIVVLPLILGLYDFILSIEYWPEPQRGIKEAYRVLKLGGKACIIGPVYPTFWLSRFFADAWMLFPKEEEYIEWFQNAGFKDIQLKRIGPKWYRGVRRHGLIMGCSVTGVKPASGDSPLQVTVLFYSESLLCCSLANPSGLHFVVGLNSI